MSTIIELLADNLHFLGNTDKECRSDPCVHGTATLRVNGHVFADSVECCLTASALRFLRTLHRNHPMGEEEFLFPCCGHMLIPSEDGKTVTIVGCTNGTEFPVCHVGNDIALGMEGGEQILLPYETYREAVKAYAEAILTFLKNSPPRQFADKWEKKGYEAFLTEYQALLSQ